MSRSLLYRARPSRGTGPNCLALPGIMGFSFDEGNVSESKHTRVAEATERFELRSGQGTGLFTPQSDSPGFFRLTGTLTLSNGCDQTSNVNGSSVVGANVDVTSSSPGLDALTGVTDSEGQQIELNDYPYPDDCIAGAHGILARQ